MCKVLLNEELNGVEMYFEGKPASEVLADIKAVGFRWNGKKVCWYAKQSEKTIAKAQSYSDSKIHTEEVKTVSTKITKKNISLWDRVQFIEGTADNSEYKDSYRYVGSNYTGLSTKETAKEIRTHLRKQFTEVKFSVKSDYNSIDIEIKSSPYSEEEQEIKMIKKYCEQLLSSYNYDDSDSMTDYFCKHFYSNVSIDYDYTQTEQTEAIKSDIENFKNKLIESKKIEEERKEKEYKEYLAQQEIKEQAYLQRQAEEKKNIEYVNNNINVVELADNENYFVMNAEFANLNKNCTLSQYQEEVKKGEYKMSNVKIQKEVHLNDSQSLEYFSKLLLNDFDFLTGTGGSNTDDKRINSMSDYDNMSQSERDTVEWYREGVAVYFNNELQFVIDAQGYNYARYVGLTDNATIQKDYTTKETLTGKEVEERTEVAEKVAELNNIVIKNNNNIDIEKIYNSDSWNVFRKEISQSIRDNKIKLNKEIIQQIKDNEYIKTSMYRLIKECEPTQDQFVNADIQEGELLTIIRTSMIGGASATHISFKEWKQESYAQYTDNIKVIYESKNKLYGTNLTNKKVLIYRGFLDIPKSVLYEATDNGIITKYGSYDDELLENILTYFERNNILPVINTYRPIF